jgi:hypothetical protein
MEEGEIDRMRERQTQRNKKREGRETERKERVRKTERMKM